MAIVAQDTFIRANQSGWGTASDGNVWATQQAGSTLAISSNEGTATGSAAQRSYLTLGSLTNVDGLVTFRFATNSQSVNNDIYALCRYTDVNNFYWIGYQRISSTSFALALRKRVAGTNTTVSSVTISPALNTFYWVKAQVQGNTLSAKFWQDGNLEPAAWSVTATDTDLTSGSLWGLAPYTAGTGATLQVDHFSVDNLGGTFSRSAPASAALLATLARNAPARARLLATPSRSVGANVQFTGTFTRAVPSSALLSAARLIPANARLLATLSRSVSSQVKLGYTPTRAIPAKVALLAVAPAGPTALSLYKQQVVMVFDHTGKYLDTWRDAPLLAGVKFAINSATSPLQVTLPRSFDDFDEAGTPGARGTVGQGNIVQFWVFGPGLPTTGLLKFQGVIDGYAPEITEAGEERVTVTIVPFDSATGDSGILGGQTFGAAGSSSSYVDPITMFNWWFSHNDPATGLPYSAALTLDATNPSSSGVNSQYTFRNQSLGSIWETVRAMLPANWYWRPNADKTVTLNVTPTSAQHAFNFGQHIVAPQYRKDWMKVKNVAQVVGTGLTTSLSAQLASGTVYTSLQVNPLPVGVLSGQKLVINDSGNPTQTVTASANAVSGATSISVSSFTANGTYPAQTQVQIQVIGTATGSDTNTYGRRVVQLADNRVTDQNTANVLAQGLLNVYDQMLLRTKVRVLDYRGDAATGIGYDIETIKPGDSCEIVNPENSASSNLWDKMEWDIDYWDYSPAASLQQPVVIVSVTYNFDYVDLELASAQPSQDRDVLKVQTAFQDFSLA